MNTRGICSRPGTRTGVGPGRVLHACVLFLATVLVQSLKAQSESTGEPPSDPSPAPAAEGDPKTDSAPAASKREEPPRPRPSPGSGDRAATDGVPLTLSLGSALEIALSNNLDRQIEQLSREIAVRQVIVERAVFDPLFNLAYSFDKNREPTVSPLDFVSLVPVLGVKDNPFDIHTFRTGFTGTTRLGTSYGISFIENRFNNPEASLFALNPRYSSRAEVTLTQPLLKNAWWNINSAGIRVARNNLARSREQYELVVIDIILNVIQAYWELVFARRNFLARANALEVSQEQLRIDRQRVRVGTIPPIDLTTSESQVARRKTEYDESKSVLETARDNLLFEMNYTGRSSLKSLWEQARDVSPYEGVDIVPSTSPETSPVVRDRGEALARAFEKRPEYRQLRIDIENQEIAVELARNRLLPELGVTAAWTQLGLEKDLSGSLDSLGSGDFYNWRVGVSLEVPLPYRGPISEYRNARAELRKLLIARHKLENSITLEVDQAIRELDYAHRAVVNLERQVELQEALLKAEKTKLEVGKSIAYTVTQIENDLVEIQAQEIRAKTDFEAVKARFEKAVGTLLERYDIDIAPPGEAP